MKGRVDEVGRALLRIDVGPHHGAPSTAIEAWIDTAFTGELVLPQSLVDSIGLQQSGTVRAVLADGGEVALPTYSCALAWFGERRDLEVVANEGAHALLGVGLLLGRELHISYRTADLSID